jgi:integrase
MAERVSAAMADTLHSIRVRQYASRELPEIATLAAIANPIQVHVMSDSQSAKASAPKTFEAVAGMYIDANKAGWKSPVHTRQWINSIRDHVCPVIGSIPVADITTDDVLRVLTPMWATTTETATRIRGRIEAILDFAATRGWRPRGANPAAWRGHLQHALPKPARVQKEEHHASLPWSEAPAFWRQLLALDTTKNATPLALRLLFLTAARKDTIRLARWDEFDLQNRVWNAPGEHMKSGKPHRYPLSRAALAVLKEAQKLRRPGNPHVFPGEGKGRLIGINSLYILLKNGMQRTDTDVHGLRATMRTWLTDETEYPWEMGEIALAHDVGSAVERAYQRSDMFEKRRKMAEDWAKYVTGK